MSTLTVQPSTADSYIRESAAEKNTNYGTQTFLLVRSFGTGNFKTLLNFDFTSLPAGATISSALLYLYYYDIAGDPVGRTYWAYEITQTGWTQTGVTFVKYDGTNNWATEGGDYTTTDGASAVVPASSGWMSWDVTTLVQHFQSSHGEIANFLIKDETDGANPERIVFFYSNNYTGDTSLCPKLVITYTTGIDLVVDNGAQSQAVGNVALTQAHNIAVASGVQAQAVGNVVLTQVHVLTVVDGVQGQAVGNVVLTQTHALTVAGGIQAQAVGNIALTQAHVLIVASGVQSQAVDNLDIVLAILLAVASGIQGQAVNNVVLSQVHNLAVAGGAQAQAAESAILTQAHNLAVAGGSQDQLVGNVILTQVVPPTAPIKVLMVSGNMIIQIS